ncbi:hypothetical protein [Bernardetia litoralis]|nr:hypothetical protein [Bernardetia litoralis]
MTKEKQYENKFRKTKAYKVHMGVEYKTDILPVSEFEIITEITQTESFY